MSIATKTGDDGETSLYSGARVPKTHARIEAVGHLDELSAALGVTISVDTEFGAELNRVQHELLDLGALVASPGSSGSMAGPLKPPQPLPLIAPMMRAAMSGSAARIRARRWGTSASG